MDINDLLESIGSRQKGFEDREFKSKKEAKAALIKFLEYKPEFQEGDCLERNDYGVANVKFPTGNQIVYFVKMLETPICNDGYLNDILVLVAVRENIFRYFETSSKFYKKAEDKKNILGFRRVK